MPRKRYINPRIGVEVRMDQALLARVQLELYDPMKRAVPLGAMTRLVEMLLTQWLEQRNAK